MLNKTLIAAAALAMSAQTVVDRDPGNPQPWRSSGHGKPTKVAKERAKTKMAAKSRRAQRKARK